MNNQNVYLKKLTFTAIFIALGVLLAPLVSFPFGGARVFPLQHLINVLLAVLLGWRYSVAGAFCISSIRIALGVGTILVTGKNQIRGLTTAAGLWTCACVGLPFGDSV